MEAVFKSWSLRLKLSLPEENPTPGEISNLKAEHIIHAFATGDPFHLLVQCEETFQNGGAYSRLAYSDSAVAGTGKAGSQTIII